VLTIPGIADLVSGKAKIDDFREVEIEDLLGRDPLNPQQELMKANISGQVVVLTGGSIIIMTATGNGEGDAVSSD
jgi:FlaA1/EpsC-like NDP-sugar epimerase